MQNAPVRRTLGPKLTPWLISLVVILLVMAAPSRASAQVTGTWDCGSSQQCGQAMGAMQGQRTFSTPEECEAWGTANFYRGSNGYRCPGGGGGKFAFKNVSTVTALLEIGILAPFVGGLGGSMVEHPNGEAMTFEGAYGAASLMGAASMLANRSNRSLIGAVFVGAATGASAYTAVNLYKQNDAKPEATERVEYTDEVKKDATKGALIGAAVNVGCCWKGSPVQDILNKLPPARWLRRTSRPVSVINRGRNVGVRIAW